MSLPDLLTALIEHVEDVLITDCGRPAVDRRLRYLNPAGLIQDCCTDNGVLSAGFTHGYASQSFPTDAQTAANPCARYPVYEIAIRYDVCWKIPKVSQSGVTLIDDAWDTDTAAITEAADCVARALARLGCNPSPGGTAQAVLDNLRDPENIRYRDVDPLVGGGCARLTWRIYAAPNTGPLS